MGTLEKGQIKIQTIINGLQLLVLIIGVAAIFMSIGRRDQQLDTAVVDLKELSSIIHDLVKAQVVSVTKDGEHDRILSDLSIRIYALEQQ
tara:strand:- start:908 stop:1177 length:270 start_codon:yes stop_codon:yes gene_type:complete